MNSKLNLAEFVVRHLIPLQRIIYPSDMFVTFLHERR